ncbi:TolB family protein [Planobispora longispora]|uniref:Uncharacterized protein n=1 Tax=Planobispora longispora TaxID=28887 RepID=A0A8J3W4U1_9ACTN|nr:hypothetical protein [Planobispora longispora]BFE86215.1 hypothetical protein GCM10020093_088160 [Planobispora longispora]GIH75845.1 hypothetical protein Plo01_22740 [Planobispora longispora]
MNDLEETLRRTLGNAAEQAPRLPGGLPERLETGYRRRRRRARTALAAAAVVVVAGGTAAGLRVGASPVAAPGTDPTGVSSATVGTEPGPRADALPEPVGTVWPQAVRTVPATGPDGRDFEPLAFIDDRTLLVTMNAGFRKNDALYAYDLDGRTFRKIADVPIPVGTVISPSDFTVGNGHVVWWTASADAFGQIWSAPLAGGEARLVADKKIADVPDKGLGSLAVIGDRIAFSEQEGGVYTVPVQGGTVEAVPDSAGMHLLDWPWIGGPGLRVPAGEARFGRIRNVETGETDTAVIRPGERSVTCDRTTCSGTSPGGRGFHRLRDGSQEKELPGGISPVEPPARGRFHVVTVWNEGSILGVVLQDLATGTSGGLGVRPEGRYVRKPRIGRDGRLLAYPVGDEMYVIDLAKIQ